MGTQDQQIENLIKEQYRLSDIIKSQREKLGQLPNTSYYIFAVATFPLSFVDKDSGWTNDIRNAAEYDRETAMSLVHGNSALAAADGRTINNAMFPAVDGSKLDTIYRDD